jgi:hypothetical protein
MHATAAARRAAATPAPNKTEASNGAPKALPSPRSKPRADA